MEENPIKTPFLCFSVFFFFSLEGQPVATDLCSMWLFWGWLKVASAPEMPRRQLDTRHSAGLKEEDHLNSMMCQRLGLAQWL